MASLALFIWLVLIAAAVIFTVAFGKGWLIRLMQAIGMWTPEPGPAGPPKCPVCGYTLYYATDRCCPECGRAFDVDELDMRQATWDGQVLRPRQTEDKT